MDLLAGDELLTRRIVDEAAPVIITSYIAVEILRALHHIAQQYKCSSLDLERRFWNICLLDSIEKQFTHALSDGLLHEFKSMAEMQIIAQLLDMEVKDIPYIVACFHKKATLVTRDIRSIITKRQAIKNILGISILTVEEFLDL